MAPSRGAAVRPAPPEHIGGKNGAQNDRYEGRHGLRPWMALRALVRAYVEWPVRRDWLAIEIALA